MRKKHPITVLTPAEIKTFRKSVTNSRTLAKIYEQVIRNIKESDVIVPLRNLIRERIRSKMNFSSIYREILFLIIIVLERELIDIGNRKNLILISKYPINKLIFLFFFLDAFDTEFRDAFKTITLSDAYQFVRLCDRPPNNVAVWCRRLFSPLLI